MQKKISRRTSADFRHRGSPGKSVSAMRRNPLPEGEGPLTYLRYVLPKRMVAAERSAYQGQRLQAKDQALMCSELRPNNEERIIVIVVDVDDENASTSWLGDAECAPPNLIITNLVNGHAHLVWILGDAIWPKKQPRAPKYALAIQRALTAACGGDASYNWPSAFVHNPWSPRYQAREVHGRRYRLGELAQGLDLDESVHRRNKKIAAVANLAKGERNDGLFKYLMRDAFCEMRKTKNKTQYENNMFSISFEANETFDPPLPAKEVRGIVKSVLRYRPYKLNRKRRTRADRRKEKRALAGRARKNYLDPTDHRKIQAHTMRESGLKHQQIAAQLGVHVRTIYRYFAKRNVTAA